MWSVCKYDIWSQKADKERSLFSVIFMQYLHLFHLKNVKYYFGYITINNGDMKSLNKLLIASTYLD